MALAGSCNLSTDEVYGSIAEGSWPETHPLEPNSPYAASKAASDLIARSYAVTHGLDIITRCSNNYGPYQFPEKVIPLFVTNLIDRLQVPLYGDGLNIRDWLHVDDHCRGIALVLDKGRAGEIYNIGGGTELANRELTARLLAACGADWDWVDYVADRKGHDRRYSVDITKISAELGYRPRVQFEQGLAETVGLVGATQDPSRRPAPMSCWLVTGAGGMLGTDLVAALTGHDVVAVSHAELDIVDAVAVQQAVGMSRPDVVANCAAWTGVDAAEDHEAQAFAVNAVGCGQHRPSVRHKLCRDGSGVHRLRFRWVGHWSVPGGLATRACFGLWAHQGCRRVGRSSTASEPVLDRPDGVALWISRAQLRPDRDPVGVNQRHHRRNQRPARPTDVVG
jgi:dTDP-D-glucose 4,6-dehydratase